MMAASAAGLDIVSLPPQKKVRISSSSNSGTASPSTPPRVKEDISKTPANPANSTASPSSSSSSSSSTPHYAPVTDFRQKGAASLWALTQNVKLEQETGASNLRQVDAEVHSTLSQASWSEPPPAHRIRAALQYLKYNALKPDPVVTGGLMRLCKAMPDLFREATISTMMIQMLRPEFTHSFKIRTNGAVVFLTCALLHQAWDDVVDWPTDFVMAYLEDALGERSWCAHSDTKSFVQNVLTAFLTNDSADSADGNFDSVRLDERANSSAIMAAIDLNDFTSSLNTIMRYKSSSVRALVKHVTLQTIWDHVPAAIGASAVDATVRSLIKVMMATVRWTEVRLKAMSCMEFWLGNFTKNAKPLLRLILRQISQQDMLNTEDIKAWEMLLDFRYSGRAHQVESVKEEIRVALIGLQGQELIRIGLQHIMAIELNTMELKNPYHLDLMELLLQSIPDNSAVEFGKLVQTRIVEAALHLNGLPDNLTAVPVVHVVKRWIKHLGKRGSSWITDMVVGLLEDERLYLPISQKQERLLRHQSLSPPMPTPLIWLRLLTEILCYIMLSTAIDAREQDDIRASKIAVSQAHVFILEWLHTTFRPTDQPTFCSASFGLVPTESLRACVARLLFLDPLMSYAIDTSTQEFDTTLIFKAIEGGLPIVEESMVSLLGLSLQPHMTLNLVGEYVSRAVEYAKVNSESLVISDATVVDKIFELALFSDSPNAEIIKRAKSVPLAWTSSFWACSLICVMIACCNPRTLGLVVWDTMPVLRTLLECSISQHYSFPPPNYTSTSDPSAESLVRRSMLLEQEDKAAVLQWEQELQQQRLDLADSEYVGSLMVSDYRRSNHTRQPPPEVLKELRSLNERYGLGMKLASSRNPDYLGRMVGPNDDSAWVDKLLRDVPEILKALPASTLCARYCRTVDASSEMDVYWGEDSVTASAAVSGFASTDLELKRKLAGHVEAFMESVARYDSNSSVFADYLTRPQARYREVCDIFEFFLGRLALLATQQLSDSQVLSGDPCQVKAAMLLLFQGDNQWPHVLLQVTTKISNPALTDQVIKWLEAIMLQDGSIAWITSGLQYLLQVDEFKASQEGHSTVVEKSLQVLSKVVVKRGFVWHWIVQHRPNMLKSLGKRLERLIVNREHRMEDTDVAMDASDMSPFATETVVVQCADGCLLRTTPEILRLTLLYLAQVGQSQGPARLQSGEPLLYAQRLPEGDWEMRKDLIKRTRDVSIAQIALDGLPPVQIFDLVNDLFGADGAVAETVVEALFKVIDNSQQDMPHYLDPEATKTTLVLLQQFAADQGHPVNTRALEMLQSRIQRSQRNDGLTMEVESKFGHEERDISVPNFFLHDFPFTPGTAVAGVAAIAVATSVYRSKSQQGREPWDPMRDRLVDYDYIIVGGGAAGCAVASRLAEDPDVRVLLLEAGGTDDIPESMTPGLFVSLIHSHEYDWRLRTVPQRHCNNREMLQPRGKLLGGSSAINAMMYHRGPHSDYNMWGELGNEGWNYQECLRYFRKAEGFNDPTLPRSHPRGPVTDRIPRPEYETFEAEYHGTDGPWQVSYHHLFDVSEAFIKANLALGVPQTQDLNGKTTIGVCRVQSFIQRDAIRSSSARAYLSPKSHVPGGGLDDQGRPRGYIRIVHYAHVERILVKTLRGTKVAVGVEFRDREGTAHKVCAVREVILSAGAYLSPAILLASGIGSPQPMIPFLHPLPGVGANMTDHLSVSVIFRGSDTCTTMGTSTSFLNMPRTRYEYQVHGRGPLSDNGVGSASFMRLEDIAPDFVKREKAAGTWQDKASGPDSPHLEFIILAAYYRQCAEIKPKDAHAPYITISVVLLNPCSVGRIGIKTSPRPKNSDGSAQPPLVEPVLDPNFLAESFDLRALTEGFRFARKLARQMMKDPAVGQPSKEVVPGDSVADDDDKAIHEFIRAEATTIFHPVGTCKMGPASDTMAVVDERLRVRGMDRLRVIDASIMPSVPAAHTTAPTIMLAEKGADMIKEDWEDPIKKDGIRNTLSKL
ncbi:hypothetical protein DFQ27_007790 [Actinomortierella ambigua]|uniref:Glucose-methanol-choline oxidoreductase N-terminal domain-containing protein n=1 Tax=Actinomortierella ambigua TaxID=1343610 RepID=A0A9P6PU98_9FUNG|nr:hypothetical protein DFQ27_007790 [Actinomortierella ambigua]